MTLEQLNKIVDEIVTRHTEYKTTPRELLEAFNAYRRTSGNVSYIDDYLKGRKIQTTPNYNTVWWLDESITLQEIPAQSQSGREKKKHLSPAERVQKCTDRGKFLKNRLDKIENIDTDLSILDKIPESLKEIPQLLSNDEITDKMKGLIYYRLITIENCLQKIDSLSKNTHNPSKGKIRNSIKDIAKCINAVRFTTTTLFNLGYLKENLVAIGANGSGKTSLAENIKRYAKYKCVVIGAQKLLLVPKFHSVLDIESSQRLLQEQQAKDKSLKQPLAYEQEDSDLKTSIADDVADEFSTVINNLLAKHNADIHNFANNYVIGATREKTILEKVFGLWHQIMPHRKLKCPDGINIIVEAEGEPDYPAYQLSDGEKVTLYLIADVMLSPDDCYIIVDEPETYLHKSIVNKLWDLLENERKNDNCIFVYLTHNIEFAESRNAKKIWIKSYNTNDNLGWDIQEIPDSEIPQELLLEILGSRRPILFCEGVMEKDNTYSDAQIFEILYPYFTIKPVHSCKDVINYTKAFNAIPNNPCKAYGIIDSDFRTEEQLAQLASENIFSNNVSEIENLFLCEDFLRGMANWLHVDADKCFSEIETSIKKLFKENIEIQVSQYVSAKIDYTFKEVHFKQANKKSDITNHYSDFCSKIKINDWIVERENELNAITNNYEEIVKVYNNKGLKSKASTPLGITNFSSRAFDYLKDSEEAREILRNILPCELRAE